MAGKNPRDDWLKYNQAIKAKRTKNTSSKEKTQRKFQGNFLTIQRLSADVSGRAQKYARIGPRDFVPIDSSEDVSLENIKRACEEYFAPRIGPNLICDVLAGERGPSCFTVDQIPDLKIVHVRFVGKSTYESIVDSFASAKSTATATDGGGNKPSEDSASSETAAEGPKPSKIPCPNTYSPSKFPLSLSVSEMIKLGKIGTAPDQTSTVVKIYTFDLSLKSWTQVPTTVEFQEESEPCGEGGFRKAYRVTSKHPEFRNKTWVMKKYLPKAKEEIENLGLTLQEHTKKTVQMHLLARNFTSQLETSIKKEDLEAFGKPLKYRKIFYGETSDEDFVTVEEFIDGNFIKYINNNGIACVDPSDLNGQKAQCLTHFSYVKSEKQLMLLDVQGSGEDLYDPEIASTDLFDDKQAILYCIGNLSKLAIANFVNHHKCNKYCKLVGLKPIAK